MTDFLIEVQPGGPEAASVAAGTSPVAATVTEAPRPVAAQVAAAPAPQVSAVAPAVRTFEVVASAGQGLELVVHPPL